jgi:hypothetical protein
MIMTAGLFQRVPVRSTTSVDVGKLRIMISVEWGCRQSCGRRLSVFAEPPI